MPVRRRHAFVYPGRNQVGLALAISNDRSISDVACGSYPGTEGYALLERFKPDILYYATDQIEDHGRVIPIPNSVRHTRVVRTGWKPLRLHNPIRSAVGRFGNFAFRMAFNELVRHGPYTWGGFRPTLADDSWVDANTPPRILR